MTVTTWEEPLVGLISKLFGGGEPDYPRLDPNHYAAARVEAVHDQIESLMGMTKDRLEVIPSEHAAYVFIGKPPKKFGVAWIHDGKISNFKNLVEEKGVKPARLQGLVEELQKAYEATSEANRYTAEIGDRTIVVTPSEKLEGAVHQAIQAVV